MTSTEICYDETPLYQHTCTCCGDPIAARHEAICESIIAIDAMDHESDVDGEFTTIYCPACLVDVLDLSENDSKDKITELLNQF